MAGDVTSSEPYSRQQAVRGVDVGGQGDAGLPVFGLRLSRSGWIFAGSFDSGATADFSRIARALQLHRKSRTCVRPEPRRETDRPEIGCWQTVPRNALVRQRMPARAAARYVPGNGVRTGVDSRQSEQADKKPGKQAGAVGITRSGGGGPLGSEPVPSANSGGERRKPYPEAVALPALAAAQLATTGGPMYSTMDLKCWIAIASLVVALASTASAVAEPRSAAAGGAVEPEAGKWRTLVLSSGSEFRLTEPPGADATREAESSQLRTLAGQRDAAASTRSTTGMPARRGIGGTRSGCRKASSASASLAPHGNYRMMALLNVAIYEATVPRGTPSTRTTAGPSERTRSDFATVIPNPRSPSYPSEHAATAAAAAAVLSYLMPDDAALFAARAEEAAHSRLFAGTEFPSDVSAGLELGRKVGERVIARARNDGFGAQWDGKMPAGPGSGPGKNPNFPLAGTWKTWIAAWDGKSSVPEPPAWDGPEMAKAVADMKAFKPTGQPNATFWPDDPAGRPAPARCEGDRADRLSLCQAESPDVGTAVVAEDLRVPLGPEPAARCTCLGADQHRLLRHPGGLLGHALPLLVSAPVPDRCVDRPTFTTPNQPAYPSGHSCIEGATSRVLEYLFPRDAAAIRSRAEELAMSRWWARIHWTWDNENGLRLGRGSATR